MHVNTVFFFKVQACLKNMLNEAFSFSFSDVFKETAIIAFYHVYFVFSKS